MVVSRVPSGPLPRPLGSPRPSGLSTHPGDIFALGDGLFKPKGTERKKSCLTYTPCKFYEIFDPISPMYSAAAERDAEHAADGCCLVRRVPSREGVD